MRRVLLHVVPLVSVVALAGIQAVRPARTNPITPSNADLRAHVRLPPEVSGILARGCGDCHSNRTRWPWYSQVAPVSWFVIDHVNHGRRHLNFSEWSTYDGDRRDTLLEGICEETSAGRMPMPSYLLIHRDARLASSDVQRLCDWARAARDRSP
jgi:hypothetical protein